MKSTLTIIFFVLSHVILSGQCENKIRLETQAQVDSFRINYPGCTNPNELVIYVECNGDQISNLDSLYGITRATMLRLSGPCSAESIEGLDNLERVDLFTLVLRDSLNHEATFQKLKYIRYLSVSFSSEDADFGMVKDVDTIRRLRTFRTGSFDMISDKAKASLDSISLQDFERPLRLSEITTNRNLLSLGKLRGGPIVIDSMFESIGGLSLDYTDDIVDRQELLIENSKIDIGSIILINIDIDSLFIFENVDTVRRLLIYRCKMGSSVDSLFPILKSIEAEMILGLNEGLESVHFHDVALPFRKPFSVFSTKRIVIQDNPDLNSCDSDFLCRAYRRYPDSISIENNGPMCTPEDILIYCLTDMEEVQEVSATFWPNPASSYFQLDFAGSSSELSMEVVDLTGKIWTTRKFFNRTTVSVEDYFPGIYIVYVSDARGQLIWSDKLVVIR